MFSIFDLTLKLNGFPIEKGKKQLESILAISETDYPEFLASTQRDIVAFHLQNNPFYRDLVGKDTFENWADLPILTKNSLSL